MKTPFHSAAPYGGLPDAAPGARSRVIPIATDLYIMGVPIYWDSQIRGLAAHVDRRGMEPYVRYVLLQWKKANT